MRFHVVGLPNTQTNKDHSGCAFTMKVLHFCQMMRSLGHEVFHYGVEGSDDNIQIMSKAEQEGFFGQRAPGCIYPVDWSGKAQYWKLFNERAAKEINKRKQPRDFVCVISGVLNKPIAKLTDLMTVEFGIGYNGTFAEYRVFESYAHMHKIYGAEGGLDPDGKFYDAVIPNYLNPSEYPFDPQAVRGDYYLYIGRLIKRKGIHIAVETCKQLGVKLKVAGGGGQLRDGKLCCEDGGEYENVDYIGFATGEQRAQLYQNAIATFVPTTYLEPFGAVCIESQMAGTPVITTDFGAFTEIVEHGKTGFRCRTLDQFVWAAKHAQDLDPKYIHEHAVANWSMDRVKYMYQEYFEMLTGLWDAGWYTVNNNRKNLNWLQQF